MLDLAQFKPIIEPSTAISSKMNYPVSLKHEVKKEIKLDVDTQEQEEARYDEDSEENCDIQ